MEVPGPVLRNRDPILQVLRPLLPKPEDEGARRPCVLSVGSGAGFHEAYFAKALPHVDFQPAKWTMYPLSRR